MGVFRLKAWEATARRRRSARDVSMEPTVLRHTWRGGGLHTRGGGYTCVRLACAYGVDSSMNESTPLRMEETDQAGTHVSGWKSLIERQRRVFVLKRPLREAGRPTARQPAARVRSRRERGAPYLGVSIMMAGGLYGYSDGKSSFPWYWPLVYGVSAGPMITKCHSRMLFGLQATKGTAREGWHRGSAKKESRHGTSRVGARTEVRRRRRAAGPWIAAGTPFAASTGRPLTPSGRERHARTRGERSVVV